jgi:hypothetical protein
VSYDFDYLDEKSIFFDEKKNGRVALNKIYFLTTKIGVLILELNFFESILN